MDRIIWHLALKNWSILIDNFLLFNSHRFIFFCSRSSSSESLSNQLSPGWLWYWVGKEVLLYFSHDHFAIEKNQVFKFSWFVYFYFTDNQILESVNFLSLLLLDIRHCMFLEFKKGYLAMKEIFFSVYVTEALIVWICQRWFESWRPGTFSLEDSPRSRRSSSINIERLQIIVQESHTQTAWECENHYKTCHFSIVKQLHGLGKVSKRWLMEFCLILFTFFILLQISS